LARALVAVAASDGNNDYSAIAIARYEWGPLLVSAGASQAN
jgi:hypothetical protein